MASEVTGFMRVGETADGKCIVELDKAAHSYAEYGLIAADIVRHIAAAFEVPEAMVWEWVDRERHHPTTTITYLGEKAPVN